MCAGDRDENEVEIQCHGGTAAVALVTECLESAGGLRELDAWSTCGKEETCDLRLEAWLDLGLVTTLKAASVLLDQASGALRREVEEIVRLLGSDQPEAAAERLAAVGRARAGGGEAARRVEGGADGPS